MPLLRGSMFFLSWEIEKIVDIAPKLFSKLILKSVSRVRICLQPAIGDLLVHHEAIGRRHHKVVETLSNEYRHLEFSKPVIRSISSF